jgi:hypothetical protein
MRNKFLSLTVALLLCFGCASQPGPSGDSSASKDAPAGTWSGDYGLGDRREPIRVELQWENGDLRGTVHAGPRSLPLTKASFKSDTGAIALEFDTEGNGGRMVHYVIDGNVSGDTMSGTWTHDDQKGDFKVTKQ